MIVLAAPELSREAAQEAARDELRRREYTDAQPPLLLRLIGRVVREIGELFDRAAGLAPGGGLGVLALLTLLALFVAVVLTRVGPLSRRTSSQALFAGTTALSAAEHRRLADGAAADGRFADAVRERLRAVVRTLEARGALDPRPGRTAGEVARDGGQAMPALADDLRRAALLFDEIWYGGRPADSASYAVLVEVDERVSGTRAARAVPT